MAACENFTFTYSLAVCRSLSCFCYDRRMMSVAAAILIFLLLAGAGIVWAVRSDDARRASKTPSSTDFGDGGVIMAYGWDLNGDGCDAGDSSGCDGGGD